MWRHRAYLLLFCIEGVCVHSPYLKDYLLLNASKLSITANLRCLGIIAM